MKKLVGKLGFTLMEVNLAIFIMAAGVMAMVSLYPLGYRENEQSRADVIGAAAADAVLNQLSGALSSRNITWEDWRSAVDQAVNATKDGWMSYCDTQGNVYSPKKKSQLNSKAQDVSRKLAGAYKDSGSPQWPVNNDLACALVAQWGRMPVMTTAASGSRPAVVSQLEDYSRVALSFRCAKKAGSLFATPVYYTEIHFQGDQKELQ